MQMPRAAKQTPAYALISSSVPIPKLLNPTAQIFLLGPQPLQRCPELPALLDGPVDEEQIDIVRVSVPVPVIVGALRYVFSAPPSVRPILVVQNMSSRFTGAISLVLFGDPAHLRLIAVELRRVDVSLVHAKADPRHEGHCAL
ncbi:hypothetical protein CTA1_8006 [Colletotrichum tanaceti]|uniref:Uncharacterized protein n=1 Tax=Colletotrichum tanaceti TaxID=1306861 RepID=A0A4U6XML6_9PEZI|nr:hypothetical protein CTA1_8006 [Colletotrichum tanaceti]